MFFSVLGLEAFIEYNTNAEPEYYLDRDRVRCDTYIHIGKLYIVVSYASYSKARNKKQRYSRNAKLLGLEAGPTD